MAHVRAGNLTGETYGGVGADKYGVSSRKFNTDFDVAMAKLDNETKAKEQLQLGLMNTEIDKSSKNLSDLTIGEFLDDGLVQVAGLLTGNMRDGQIFAQRRLFYLGVVCILLGLVVWAVDGMVPSTGEFM